MANSISFNDNKLNLSEGLTLVPHKEYNDQFSLEDLDHYQYGFYNKEQETLRILIWEDKTLSQVVFIENIEGFDLDQEQHNLTISFKDGTFGTCQGMEKEEYLIPTEKTVYDKSLVALEKVVRETFTEEQLKQYLYVNDLDQKIYLNYQLFHKKGLFPLEEYGIIQITQIIEENQSYYNEKTQKKVNRAISDTKMEKVLRKIAMDNRKNPFLEEIEKTPTNDNLDCSTYLRDVGFSTRLTNSYEDEQLILKTVSESIFLAALELQYQEGNGRTIKFVPIFVGETNLGKSLIVKQLGLNFQNHHDHYYSETTESFEDIKKFDESVEGSVIVELSEGSTFKTMSEEKKKAHFDRMESRYRLSYGRSSVTRPKRYFEIITTNDNEVLTDITGNVRYFTLFLDGLDEPLLDPRRDITREMMLGYWKDAYNKYHEEGKRWYTEIDHNPRILEIMKTINYTVTEEIEGLPSLIDFINTNYPNVGDFIPNESLKEILLKEVGMVEPKKIDKTLRLFRKSCNLHGLKRLDHPKIIREGLTQVSKRGYERISKSKQ